MYSRFAIPCFMGIVLGQLYRIGKFARTQLYPGTKVAIAIAIATFALGGGVWRISFHTAAVMPGTTVVNTSGCPVRDWLASRNLHHVITMSELMQTNLWQSLMTRTDPNVEPIDQSRARDPLLRGHHCCGHHSWLHCCMRAYSPYPGSQGRKLR